MTEPLLTAQMALVVGLPAMTETVVRGRTLTVPGL